MVVPLNDDQFVLREILAAHVPGPAGRILQAADADAFSLADSIEREPDMLPHGLALGRAHRTGLPRQIAVQELAKRPFADEADSGRAALGEVVQSGLLGDSAHFGLPQLPDGEHDARELRLSEAMQEIALILGRIDRLEQFEPSRRFSHARIVAGGDVLRAQRHRMVQESLELDFGIAQDVRVGRAACRIFREEGAEDALLVLGREIHRLELDSDHLGDRGAVDEVLPRRAVLVVVVLLPVLHEKADHVEAPALQEQRGDRRIHAARHAYDYPVARHRRTQATRRWFLRMNSAMRATPCSIAVFEAA